MASLHPDRLRSIIRFTLEQMEMHSPTAEELLLGTAAHESHLGRRLIEYPGGPARGLYQMDPAAEAEIWQKYISPKGYVAHIRDLTGVDRPSVLNLQFNLIYSTAMACLRYHRTNEYLPAPGDLPALADYWDRHWNRYQDDVFPAQFILDYRRFVLNPQPDPPYAGPIQLHLDGIGDLPENKCR